MNWWVESTKKFVQLKVIFNSYLFYFSFCNYWMYFGFSFYFFVWYSYRITSSTIGLKICAIAAGIKMYKSIIKKKKKKHDKIVLLAKSKLNNIWLLISKALIDSNIGHDEFVLMHKVLKEYNYMKEEIKNLKT